MALIRLYKINDKISLENNSLLVFNNGTERNNFFNSLPIKETITTQLSAHWKKQIWDLETTLTIYQEGRRPLSEYNYLNINQDSFNHYYFILGYEELGRNQVRYKLRKDTLNTYCSNSNYGVDINNSEGLVLREHKDRFSNGATAGDLIPYFDKELEKVDLFPDVLDYMEILDNSQRVKLVLKQFGGTISRSSNEKYKILSTPKLYWEVFHTVDKINYTGKDSNDFYLEFGWGFNSYDETRVEFMNSDRMVLKPTYNEDYVFAFQKYITSSRSYYCISLFDLNSGQPINIVDYVNTDYGQDSFTLLNGVMVLDIDFSERKDVGLRVYGSYDINIYYDLGIDYDYQESENYAYLSTLGPCSTRSDKNINRNSGTIEKIIELPYSPLNVNLGTSESAYIEILDPVKLNLENNKNEFLFKSQIYMLEEAEESIRYVEDPKLETSQFNPLFLTWYGELIMLRKESFHYRSGTKFQVILNDSDYSKARIDAVDQASYTFSQYGELSRNIDLNNEVTVIGSDLKRHIELQAVNDLKLMQLQDAQSQRNLSKQRFSAISGAAVGAVGGFMVGNVPGAVFGALSGLALAGINYSYSYAQAIDDQKKREIEYNNKMIELESSVINFVGGSPEMNRLNNVDKIKMSSYSLKTSSREYLNTYFHYYGYTTLRIGKIGGRTRNYFDFKEVVIEKLKTSINLTNEVRNDIIDRFSKGVTRFYSYKNIFDFEQKFENWEVGLNLL